MDDLNDYHSYWQMQLLAEGGAKAREMPRARQYLEQFQSSTKQDDRALQQLLMQGLLAGSQEAALCLRCYVSHWIVRTIRTMISNFGQNYQLHEKELLPYVLTDGGELDIVIEGQSLRRPPRFTNPQGECFQPLAYQILGTFKPDRDTSLKSWTARLTQQEQSLRKMLKEERGLLLMTSWALLNDTKAIALNNILLKYHGASEERRDRLAKVLTVYREVYLADRLAMPRSKSCQPPTIEQLERMRAKLSGLPGGAIASPHDLMDLLEEIATIIRDHRLGNHAMQPDRLVHKDQGCTEIPSELAATEHLLSTILSESLTKRLGKMRGQKRERFLQALSLLYVQGLTQKEIATQLGLPRQDNVSKLLSFSKLRSGMECHMLTFLRSRIASVETACQNPDRLLEIQSDIAAYLEPYFKEDEIWRYTQPGLRKEKSQLGILICEFVLKGALA